MIKAYTVADLSRDMYHCVSGTEFVTKADFDLIQAKLDKAVEQRNFEIGYGREEETSLIQSIIEAHDRQLAEIGKG